MSSSKNLQNLSFEDLFPRHLNFPQNFASSSHELTSGVCAEIISHIDFIHFLLIKASFTVRPYTGKGIQKLLSLDSDARLEVLERLKNWKAILVSGGDSLETVNESFMAARALTHFRLKFKGMNWDQIAENEIIEIYNNEGVQLYRSLNFFSICGYSLLDLCVNRWFELWERPTATIEQMNQVVMSVLTHQKSDFETHIRPHLVRETYDDGTTQPFIPRATLVNFNKIFPLYSGDNPGVMGFLVTSTGKPISVGDEALELGFI